MASKKTVAGGHRSKKAANKWLHIPESGLSNVYLANGWRFEESPLGQLFSIKDDRALWAALARRVIEQPYQPSGEELRYLRVYLNLNKTDLATLLGVSDQQVTRWESELSRIKPATFRLLSLLVRERIGEKVRIEATLRTTSETARRSRKRHAKILAFRRGGWKTKEMSET